MSSGVDDADNNHKIQLTELSSLIIVSLNFFKSSINTPNDVRPLLLNHFVTNNVGRTLIQSLFCAYQTLSNKILLLNNKKEEMEEQVQSTVQQPQASEELYDDSNNVFTEPMEVGSNDQSKLTHTTSQVPPETKNGNFLPFMLYNYEILYSPRS
jgi:hypothetical protein